MKKYLKLNSLKSKIIIISLSLFSLIIICLTALILHTVKTNMEKTLLEKGIELTQEIENQIEYGVKHEQINAQKIMQKIVEQKASQNNIAYAVIIDKKVTAIAHSDQQKLGKVYADDPYTKDGAVNGNIKTSKFYADVQKVWTYDIMVPLYINGEHVGALDIGIPIYGIEKTINIVLQRVIILSITSFILISLGLSIAINKLLNPLSKLSNLVHATANLDLSHEESYNTLRNFNDEIGIMSNGILDMRIALRKMIQSIHQHSEKTYSSSEKLSTATQETAIALNEVAKATNDLAQGATIQAKESTIGIENLSSLEKVINHTSTNSQVVKENLDKTGIASKNGIQSINSLKNKINDTLNISKKVDDNVNTLSDKSHLVGNIVDTIKEIATQTNLLALNASIEAARAGESGRGFAVVADEIRKLAEQTDTATKDIHKIISEMQSDIKNASENMSITNTMVDATSKASIETAHAFESILKTAKINIYQIENLIQNIATIDHDQASVFHSIENISSISQQAAASTEEVNSNIEEQTATIQEISSMATHLEEIAGKLKEEVSRFKI
ncbi:MAG: methyl-accepting chemotaxis protein [Marinisporobacter sp.]|jgi:methyl-accepting chemotaxis protein|nr:methyl-accepting chemotaxis protein [Marinisporobacter sp.]